MRKGFSLVELSIVLVILGLLTGGILAGQSLIRAAELRAVGTEYQRYLTAASAFKDKYFTIPGDFNNAQAFWGAQGTNCSGTVTTVNATGACNGNGDGIMNQAGAVSSTGETMQMWRHLALAGLIEGNYSGISGSGGTQHCMPGTNCPMSKLNGGGWSIDYDGTTAGNGSRYAVYYGNFLSFGAFATNSGTSDPILKPEEAWNIDTKLDDGKPASGKIVARFWNNLCAAPDTGTAAATNLVASYRLSDSTLQCALHFRQFVGN